MGGILIGKLGGCPNSGIFGIFWDTGFFLIYFSHYIIFIVYIMEATKKSFSISYDQYLQDIAGNVLSVSVVSNSYDPVADEIVRGIADKVDKYAVKEEGDSVVFEFNKEIANQAHAIPLVASISSISPAEFDTTQRI